MNNMNYTKFLFNQPEFSMLLKPIINDTTKIIEHDGHAMTLRQWVEFLNGAIPYDTLRMRYRRGLRGDELFKQVRPRTPAKT